MAWCVTVRHDALVTSVRPHTRDYTDEARQSLGLAFTRARELAGHKWRPSFAKAAGIAVRSLVKLEKGEPVGPTVYEAAARALPGWTEDTPRAILEGGEAPIGEPAGAERDPDSISEDEEDEALTIMYGVYKRQFGPQEAARRIAQEKRELQAARAARALRRQGTSPGRTSSE